MTIATFSTLTHAGAGGYRATCEDFDLNYGEGLVTPCTKYRYYDQLASQLYVCGADGYIGSLDTYFQCSEVKTVNGKNYSSSAIESGKSIVGSSLKYE
jgi:hypothetical protein